MKRQPAEWGHMLANNTSGKGLISQNLQRSSMFSTPRKTATQLKKKMDKGPEQTFLQMGHTDVLLLFKFQ